MYRSDVPVNTNPLTLFEFSVRKVISLGMMNVSNTHQAWANLIFNYEKKAFVRSELMSVVKREYPRYFDEELQYMFLEEKIRANFPHFFGIEEELNIFDRMLQALDAECIEQKDPRNRKMYKVSSLDIISTQDGQYVYKAHLIIEEGDDPHFSEGIPFEFRTDETIYSCEVVEFDYVNAILFFSSTRHIFATYNSRVVSDATINTIALMKLLKEISCHAINETLPLHKFLNNTTRNIANIDHAPYPSYLDELLANDRSQHDAFKAAINKDITFIWGPPGTGKSFTLAAIIMALHKMLGERTAVCCLSNVAVDQLVNKVVDIIEVHEPEMPRGEFYRAGRTKDEKLLATDFLFPDDDTARGLRLRIRLFNKRIDEFKKSNLQYSDDAIKIKTKLKDAREELKKHTDYLVSKVKIVFSTI